MTQTIEQLTEEKKLIALQLEETVEQLTARVRELDEENARLKETLVDHGEIQKSLCENLSASQAYAEQLRVALQTFIDEHEECTDADDWMAMMCSIEAHHVAEEALALSRDASALDAYVAKRLHDMACDKGLLRIQVEELTRQRDLAVEALRKCRYRSLVDKVVDDALEAIKESEAMAQGEKK